MEKQMAGLVEKVADAVKGLGGAVAGLEATAEKTAAGLEAAAQNAAASSMPGPEA